jgi:hypothetical protein
MLFAGGSDPGTILNVRLEARLREFLLILPTTRVVGYFRAVPLEGGTHSCRASEPCCDWLHLALLQIPSGMAAGTRLQTQVTRKLPQFRCKFAANSLLSSDFLVNLKR